MESVLLAKPVPTGDGECVYEVGDGRYGPRQISEMALECLPCPR